MLFFPSTEKGRACLKRGACPSTGPESHQGLQAASPLSPTPTHRAGNCLRQQRHSLTLALPSAGLQVRERVGFREDRPAQRSCLWRKFPLSEGEGLVSYNQHRNKSRRGGGGPGPGLGERRLCGQQLWIFLSRQRKSLRRPSNPSLGRTTNPLLT